MAIHTPPALKTYLNHCPTRTYKKGEIILYAGDSPTGVFFLKKGYVRQFSISSEGRELTLHIYEPGSFFPLHWVINKVMPNYNLEALSPVRVQVCPRKQFLSFISLKPEVLFQLTQRLLWGLTGLTHRIEIVSLENANTRVTQTIKYLAKHFGRKKQTNTIISIKFTHDDIAKIAGLTRERVSIEMKKLEKQNKILYTNHKIVIPDISKLA